MATDPRLDNTAYLPTNFRTYVGDKSRLYTDASNDYLYLRLYPPIERYALYNNLRAYAWYTAYVPNVHNTFLSSGIGFDCVDIVSSKVLNSFKISGADNKEESRDKTDVDSFLKELGDKIPINIASAVYQTVAKGATLIRILKDRNLKPYLDVVPLGRFKVVLNEQKEIIESYTFIEKYEPKNMTSSWQDCYIICEHRFYKDNKPKIRYTMQKLSFLSSSSIFSEEHNIVTQLEYKDIPKDILAMYKHYSFNKISDLGFQENLGVFLLNNTGYNSKYNTVWFGDALLVNAGDALYAYDHAFTAKENDKYLGRGRALIPSLMQKDTEDFPFTASTFVKDSSMMQGRAARRRPAAQLDNTFYQEVSIATAGSNLDAKIQPTSIQFNLRTLEWSAELDRCAGDIARICKISSSDLDARLNNGVQKTATEVTNETDITRNTIEAKRALFTPVLIELYKTLAEYLRYENLNLFIDWAPAGVTNLTAMTSIITQQITSGLISRETAIRKLNPYWTDEEVKEELERLNNEQQSQPEENTFGNI